MSQLIASYLTSPEEMKAMFQNECKTDVVDSEPLLSMYLPLISELDWEDDSEFADAGAPAAGTERVLPDSAIACRPKGDDDMAAIQCVLTCCLSGLPSASWTVYVQVSPAHHGAWSGAPEIIVDCEIVDATIVLIQFYCTTEVVSKGTWHVYGNRQLVHLHRARQYRISTPHMHSAQQNCCCESETRHSGQIHFCMYRTPVVLLSLILEVP